MEGEQAGLDLLTIIHERNVKGVVTLFLEKTNPYPEFIHFSICMCNFIVKDFTHWE